MATEWFSVAADTRRQFSTLTDASGAPLDLTGMTATLRVAEATLGRRFRFAKPGVVVQAGTAPAFTNQGVVAYDPAAGDVAAPGDYLCQWSLASIAGDFRTVPDFEPFLWHISPRIQ